MKRILSLLTLFCLTLLVHAEVSEPTVVVYWQFQSYPGSIQSVSRVTVQGMPPYPKINGVYQIPNPIAFFPGVYPMITNGIVSTNVAVDTPLKVTFSGPFGSRSVTNFFPSILTNGAGPYNAGIYDVQAIAQFNDYIIGIWFNGTNFLGAGLAPTNLTGAQGITIGGVYPNYIVGAQGQIITNMDTLAVALSNNLSANNITANTNLTVVQNTTTAGLTSAAITNTGPTTNQLLFLSTGGQETTIPFFTVTNGVSAALMALNTATSNAMAATNAALLVTITAGSNSIANSLAATNIALLSTITASSNTAASMLSATNTAILTTITTGSNAIAGQLAATNTALLVTIAAGSNSIANSLAATNTALLATLSTESNHFVTALIAANSVLATAIVNATNSINAASLTGTAPVAVLPAATVSQLGVVRADNATITNVGGVLYAVYTNNGSVFSISGDGVLITNTITHSGSFATVPAAGYTFLGGPQGVGSGIPSYQPYSAITNALSTQLLSLNTATSNALTAMNTALLVTISAGSNAIAGQLAATNTALLVTIAAGSNAISGQLAATNTALLATITASSNSAASMLAATNTALIETILATSNAPAAALAATNTALLVTIAAGSNSIANSLAATNTALLMTIASDSNTISGRLLATNTALLATIAIGSNSIAAQLADTNTALLTTIATGSNAIAGALAATNSALLTDIVNATNTINGASLVAGPVPTGVLPVATSGSLGIIRPDNATITVSGGVISASVAGISGIPLINGHGSNTFLFEPVTTNLTNIGKLNLFSTLAFPDGSQIAENFGGNLNFTANGGQMNFGWTTPTNGIINAGTINGTTFNVGSLSLTNSSTLSASFLGSDSAGNVIAPAIFQASIIMNVPGTNRYYDNVGRFEVDTNLNLLGTLEINGTNAATGQVLTAINDSGGVAFGPGRSPTLNPIQFFSDGTKTNLETNQTFDVVTATGSFGLNTGGASMSGDAFGDVSILGNYISFDETTPFDGGSSAIAFNFQANNEFVLGGIGGIISDFGSSNISIFLPQVVNRVLTVDSSTQGAGDGSFRAGAIVANTSITLGGVTKTTWPSSGSTPTFTGQFGYNAGNGTNFIGPVTNEQNYNVTLLGTVTNSTTYTTNTAAVTTNVGTFWTNYIGVAITNISFGNTNVYANGIWTTSNSAGTNQVTTTTFAFTNGPNWIQWDGVRLNVGGAYNFSPTGFTNLTAALTFYNFGANSTASISNLQAQVVTASTGFFGTFVTTNVNTTQLVWGRDTQDGDGNYVPSGGLIVTNWTLNFATNLYFLGSLSNSLCPSNFVGLLPNQVAFTRLLFYSTNAQNIYPSFLSFASNSTLNITPHNWSRGYQLPTYVSGAALSLYEMDVLAFISAGNVTNVIMELKPPSQSFVVSDGTSTTYYGAWGITNLGGILSVNGSQVKIGPVGAESTSVTSTAFTIGYSGATRFNMGQMALVLRVPITYTGISAGDVFLQLQPIMLAPPLLTWASSNIFNGNVPQTSTSNYMGTFVQTNLIASSSSGMVLSNQWFSTLGNGTNGLFSLKFHIQAISADGTVAFESAVDGSVTFKDAPAIGYTILSHVDPVWQSDNVATVPSAITYSANSTGCAVSLQAANNSPINVTTDGTARWTWKK